MLERYEGTEVMVEKRRTPEEIRLWLSLQCFDYRPVISTVRIKIGQQMVSKNLKICMPEAET